jgi:hypothetical protein
MSSKINTSRFYHEWKGHPIEDVSLFHSTIVSQRKLKPIIYLAGDSSLDNKYWVPSSGSHGEPLPVAVPGIYQDVLDRPQPKPDVAFWLNHFLGQKATALNLAVEESMLRQRDNDLLDHDKFIRDNIRAEDILVVSVGANDIALRPTLLTMIHMLRLAWLTPRSSLEKGTAWALSYFIRMFKNQVQAYVSRIIEKQKPKAVVVCMIYYPLEAKASQQKSWADLPLKLLGYNRYPGQLKASIRAMYALATKNIEIPGTKVIPCALFEVLDGTKSASYTARVEPSSEGGREMASHIIESLKAFLS